MKKQIAILGSTGSIGTQALQVIKEHPDQYEAYALTANNRVEDLINQAREFKPEVVVIANEDKYRQLKEALADLPIKVYAGSDALCQIVQESEVDMVLTAMVGYAGLRPTLKAIQAHKTIALANKETLVVAGDLVSRLALANGTPILGDARYGHGERMKLPLCLWAAELRFAHPVGGQRMDFRVYPPETLPWTLFDIERYLGINIKNV